MYRVCHFAHNPVRVLDKFLHGERFFSPYVKNLSPYCKSSNQSMHNLSLASSRTGKIAKSLSHKMIFLRGPGAENKIKVREIILRKIRGTSVLAARKKSL
jgi:hypothetical protein